jgi:threonine dehydrogenase-like Zn-dependent dehydrogenase
VSDHRALVIAKPGSIQLEAAAPLAPGYGEVVARPGFVGVCGTDLELLDGVVDPAYVRYPLVPGHEWAGVITRVGPGVSGLSPGQVVISEGIVPDRVCAQCVRGNTNLCVVYDEIGFTRAGAAADQILLPAQVVHPLPPGADLAEAALAEPAAVESAFRLARRGGRVLLLGLAGNGVKAGLPIDDVVNNDLMITASFGYTSAAWAEVTGLLSAGQLSLGALITHRFPLDRYADAYATLRRGQGPRGKVLIEVTAS